VAKGEGSIDRRKLVRAIPKEGTIPGRASSLGRATKSEFVVGFVASRSHARAHIGPIYGRANWQPLQPLGIMPINTFFDESTARMRVRMRMDGGVYPVLCRRRRDEQSFFFFFITVSHRARLYRDPPLDK